MAPRLATPSTVSRDSNHAQLSILGAELIRLPQFLQPQRGKGSRVLANA
jgi:hypothetical protein